MGGVLSLTGLAQTMRNGEHRWRGGRLQMGEDKETLYYVLPEGATQEETWTWSEIETRCKTGRLAPESRIYSPERRRWERVADTEFGAFMKAAHGADEQGKDEQADDAELLHSEYEAALKQIRSAPNRVDGYIRAAGAALALGDRRSAVGHFQSALDVQPFNKRVASEARRSLSFEECRQLRLLEREAPFWEDIHRVVSYPLARGPRYFLLLAFVLSLVISFPVLTSAAVFLCYLFGYQVIAETAAGIRKPPSWRGVTDDPSARILKPFLTGIVASAILGLPFLTIAEMMILIGASTHSDVFHFIQHSPIMIVFMWILGLSYLPAMLAVSASSQSRLMDALNMRKVITVAIGMEYEYCGTVGVLLAFLSVWGGSRLLLSPVPFLGVVVPSCIAVYGILCGGFVLGRLSSRHRHLWGNRADDGSREIQ